MSKLPFGVKIGLMFSGIYFAAGLIACIFVYPFVFTAYGWQLMASIAAISFVASLAINEMILKSFQNSLSKSKEYWCAFDWSITFTLWTLATYLPRPINHVLFFVGFGYLAASLIAKLFLLSKERA